MLGIAGGTPVQDTLALGLLGLNALVVEGRASYSSGFGFYSLAFPMYLGAAINPQVGVRAAVVLVLTGLISRTVFRGGVTFEARIKEALADAVPILTGMLAPTFLIDSGLLPHDGPWVRLLVALTFYIPLTYMVPVRVLGGDVNPEELAAVRLNFFPLQVSAALLAPLVYVGAQEKVWVILAFGPVLVAGSRLAQSVSDDITERRLQRLRHRKEVAEQTASQLDVQLSSTKKDLRQKVAERVLLEELSRELAGSPDLQNTLAMSTKMIQRVVGCQTIVFFVWEDDRLVPRSWSGPHQHSLERAQLVGAQEPLVEECWRTRRVHLLQPKHQTPDRIFVSEPVAVALPMQRLGVLYVGRMEKTPFTREELHLLAVVGDQTVPAALSAMRQHTLTQTLDSYSEANRRLSRWNKRLGVLLEEGAQMASTLDGQQILASLETLSRKLIQHQVGIILSSARTVLRSWPSSVRPAAGLFELAESVLTQGRPLLFEEVRRSRFGDVLGGIESLLVMPLLAEERAFGVLILGAAPPGAFAREDQDLLQAATMQAAAVMKSSQLFAEVTEAHQALERSQAQLMQSSKMAAVGQLAAGVAHEINSPLAAILLAIQSVRMSMQRGKLETVDGKLERAEEAAKGAREIISKLMIYSRQAPTAHEKLEPLDIFRDTIDLIGPQITNQKVALEQDLRVTGPIKGNRTELQQVLTNLMVNARDACVDAAVTEPRVVCRLYEHQDVVWFEVEDNGPGVPEEHRPRIFEPFYTTKDVGRGTGLGLSVSLELVEAHTGELLFETELGRGTVFRVAIPRFHPVS